MSDESIQPGQPGEPKKGACAPTEKDQSPDVRDHPEELKPVFIAWERLRPLFNVVLFLCGPCYLGISLTLGHMPQIIERFLEANFYYFAGFATEYSLRWMGSSPKLTRWVVFVVGTAYAGLEVFRRMEDILFRDAMP